MLLILAGDREMRTPPSVSGVITSIFRDGAYVGEL
jgi:hypothetical protein